MAEQDLIKLARENVELFNRGDWTAYEQSMAPDCVYHEYATQQRVQGARQVVETDKVWKRAFPDAKGTIRSVLPSGNTAVVEVTWAGTQTGPLEGPAGTIPPSGKRAEVQAVLILTFEGGKVKESCQYFDLLGMLQQIGAIPEMARAT